MGQIATILEIINSSIQLCVLAFLVVWSARQKREQWLFHLITGAFGCYFLGSLFWLFYVFTAGDWPQVFSAADLSFLGYYCFFLAVAAGLKEKWTKGQLAAAEKCRTTALIGPATVLLFHIGYLLLYRPVVKNALSFVVLSFLFYHTLLGFFAGGAYRRYHSAVLAVFALELLVLLTGNFYWDAYDIGYHVTSYIQMAAWFFIIPAARKGASA